MALQVINVGATPNDGTGDAIRTAYIKCNNNFAEIYSRAQSAPPSSNIGSIGDQAGMYAYDSNYFYYCYANYDGINPIWAEVAQIGNVAATILASGNSNIAFSSIGGNIVFGVTGTSNVAIVRTDGLSVNGNIASSGNVNSGNINFTGIISGSGNVTGANILAQGILSTTGAIRSDSGGAFQGAFIESFNDGVVVDYITGNGRISVGSGDGINFYNGGVGSTLIASFNTVGALTLGTSGTANLTAGNITLSGNLTVNGTTTTVNTETATQLSASGNITGGNLLTGGIVSAASYIGSVASISANITGGNLLTTGEVSASGNVTGQYLKGDGSLITGITVTAGSQIINGTSNVTVIANSNVTVGIASSTVATFASTGEYITGVVSASGNITSAANVAGGNILATTIVSGASHIGSLVSVSSNITGGNVLATTTVSAASHIGSTVSVTANITGGNILTGGLVSSTGNITSAANIAGGNVLATTTVNAASFTGSVVSVTGAITGTDITGTSLNVSTGTITGGNIVNANANGVGNIGSSTTYFNTVFAKATSAQYADLAENYLADADYEPGTVVVLGGTAEITVSAKDQDRAVAGVVSTQPAYIMNTKLEGDNIVTVALIGRVPCKVQGPISKGDLLVSTVNGRARSEDNPKVGSVIGKALQSFDGDTGIIEIVVGKL